MCCVSSSSSCSRSLQYPWWPVDGVRSLGLELQLLVSCPKQLLGIQEEQTFSTLKAAFTTMSLVSLEASCGLSRCSEAPEACT